MRRSGHRYGRRRQTSHHTHHCRHRSSSNPPWRKLLWIRQQGYPDNYTDEKTFLDHLQRNPRLQPYQFWPLIADLTVIVQHVCSVVIFGCCFVGIFQNRVSPYSITGFGSAATAIGWLGHEVFLSSFNDKENKGKMADSSLSLGSDKAVGGQIRGDGLSLKTSEARPREDDEIEKEIVDVAPSSIYALSSLTFTPSSTFPITSTSHRRLVTLRSTILIMCALLGLSPILKSLTKSTTSDSIWAMAFWLMLINILFFDYSAFSPSQAGMPASLSLSTNAALMASTVLASRLTDTTDVFLLILFSIEIFGIFPFFRRHLREVSWGAHVFLTVVLVLAAGAGVGLSLTGPEFCLPGAIVGAMASLLGSSFLMGMCSWWLIGLQKYKNELHGPWDPARPVIRRRWDA